MTPELHFRVSTPYNRNIREWRKLDEYPSREELRAFARALERRWQDGGSEVLNLMAKRLKQPWKTAMQVCYIVGPVRPFSDPLTMPIHTDLEEAFDVLTHEMTHRYQIDLNFSQSVGWRKLRERFPDESYIAGRHISVHAMHKHIYLATGREDRLRLNIERSQKSQPYRRAWEIVETEGHDKILDLLRDNYQFEEKAG